jgi:hypothetical protein
MTSPDHARDELHDLLERHGSNIDAWEAAGDAYAASPTAANWARFQRAEAAFLATRRRMDAIEAAMLIQGVLRRVVGSN